VTILPEVQRLLFRQCHLIDSGDADGWAETYLPDGVFDSPTYGRPVSGRAELRDFARRVHSDSPRLRHVLTNLCLVEQSGPDKCLAAGTLLIVTATDDGARVDRVTTVHDHLVRRDGTWQVARRDVVPA
jgi:3-phenylpropionate/cinnamic acid dioxygenase small subunit